MKKDKKSPLNSRFHKARLERGWSQQDLAELVGTTFVNISRWENGSNFPTPYYRQKLCIIARNSARFLAKRLLNLV